MLNLENKVEIKYLLRSRKVVAILNNEEKDDNIEECMYYKWKLFSIIIIKRKVNTILMKIRFCLVVYLIFSCVSFSSSIVMMNTSQTMIQTPTNSVADFSTPSTVMGESISQTCGQMPSVPVQPIPMPTIPSSPQSQPIQVTPILSLPPLLPQNPPQSVQLYDISLNNTLIKQLQAIPNLSLTPFLISSNSQNMSQDKMDIIMTFIINKVSITQQFTVILINQIRYAVRIVLVMVNSNKIFEALVSYAYQNGDIVTFQMQLLKWKQIDNVADIDQDVFTRYYNLQISAVTTELQNLIVRAFKNQQSISNYQQLISIEKKVSFDGIYYRVTLDSLSSTRYQIVLYWVPEIDYLQILMYVIMQNGYIASEETVFNETLLSDVYFNVAKTNVINSFLGILSDSSIVYIAFFQTTTQKYFRFVFEGFSGRYEAILTVDVQNLVTTIVRWQKVDDGYISQNIYNFKYDQNYFQIISFAQIYLNNKMGQILFPTFLQYKVIPTYCKYFKLMYNEPFPFFLIIDDKDINGEINILGLQIIQIIPDSLYYNDRLFAGFSLIMIQQLKYDIIYQSFYAFLIVINQGITDSNNQVVAAFRLDVPSGSYYRIIYQITSTSQLILVTFFYNSGTGDYLILSISLYIQEIQPGDYRWKCSQYNTSTGECSTCESDQYLLTVGRCYLQLNGCWFQMAFTCFVCNAGYMKIGSLCSKLPEISNNSSTNNIVVSPNPYPTPQPNSTSNSSSSQLSQLLTNSFDGDICLRYNGTICILCAYRFYLNNGDCIKMQDECKSYDNSTGTCNICYTAYYLDNFGVCQPLKPQCMEGNSNGVCTACYQGYNLINDQCIIAATKATENDVAITNSTKKVIPLLSTNDLENQILY